MYIYLGVCDKYICLINFHLCFINALIKLDGEIKATLF